MLAEFVLMPSIFDERANPDVGRWHDQLRELANGLFPKGLSRPVVISNLFDGCWLAEASRRIGEIKNFNSRTLCKSLLSKIESLAVMRPKPSANASIKVDDDSWWREVRRADKVMSFESIVSHCRTDNVPGAGLNLVDLDDTLHDEFWAKHTATRLVPDDPSIQSRLLAKLGLFSDWLCVIGPYYGDPSGPESTFAVKCLAASFNRPIGWSKPEVVELLSFGFRDLSGLKRMLKNELREGMAVDLLSCGKFEDRWVIGGTFRTREGKRIRFARWGVSTSHVDGRRHGSGQQRPWTFFAGHELTAVFEQFCDPNKRGAWLVDTVNG